MQSIRNSRIAGAGGNGHTELAPRNDLAAMALVAGAKLGRVRGGLLAGLLIGAGVISAARADAGVAVPSTVRASPVSYAPGTNEPRVGTEVALNEVNDIEFATGWVGYALGGPQGSGFPLKTSDGGRTWSIDGPAFFLPVADGASVVTDLAVASASDAYAYGGSSGGSSIAVTTDAGRRWWRAYLGQAVVAAAQHGRDIWALAAGPQSPPSGLNAVAPMWLYDSTDGGRSWSYRATLPDVRGWEADLARPSANVGFALVKGFGSERAVDAGIVETTDGGTTWTKRSDPCERTRARRSFGFTQRLQADSPTSLWLFCGAQPSAGEQAKLVWRSSNSGQTWTLVDASALGESARSNDIAAAGELPETGTTGDLSAPSRSAAWLILVGSDVLWKTTDGGRNWTAGAPARIDEQLPQELSIAQRSVFVRTANALWRRSSTGWKLVAGAPTPH